MSNKAIIGAFEEALNRDDFEAVAAFHADAVPIGVQT